MTINPVQERVTMTYPPANLPAADGDGPAPATPAELAALRRRVADLEHAEAALRATEGYAQSIFHTAREPLLLLDEDLRVRAANRSFYAAFRVHPDETEGRLVHELGDHQWDVPALRLLLEEVLRADAYVEDFKVEHDLPRVGHKVMLLNARRVSTADGRGHRLLLAFEDVTARKQVQEERRRVQEELEERVRQRTAELEAANRELEAFAYSVSHDLRSPLRALDGYGRILLEEHAADLPAEVQEYLRDIRRNSQRMGQLIDDLLSFSRLGRQGLRVGTVAPAALVREALQDLRSEWEGRPVEVVVGELPPCQADPALLKQVWANLLGNALKYTRGRHPARVEVGSLEQGGERVYYVRDNGVGFDMRYAGKLFGVFQRLHRADEFEGTGIGLANVRRIVHRHGGRVWAEAAVNRGAAFFFTLPRCEEQP